MRHENEELGDQTRAETKGAEMENSDEQEGAVNPTNNTCPLLPLSAGGELMSAGGMPSCTNPRLNWQQHGSSVLTSTVHHWLGEVRKHNAVLAHLSDRAVTLSTLHECPSLQEANQAG